MNVKLENIEKNVAQIEIEVEAAQFNEGLEKAYIKNKGKFSIPGFRKGKVPRKMVEKYYGEGVLYDEAINIVCAEVYPEAIKEVNIEPVDRPEIDIKQIGNGESFIFIAKVAVKPEVELREYKGIEINKIEYNVTEEDIDNEIKKMQEKNSRLVTIEDRAVEDGDTVEIDFEGFIDGNPFEGGKGEKYNLQIGSGQFIPGFEEQLIGKNAGDDVNVNVSFPESYQAEDLAGKPVVFEVKIHRVMKKELPELDDEFSKDVSEFDTMDELKQDIESKLKKEADQRQKREIENAVIEKIIEGMSFDIPEVMIETQIDNIARDINMNLMSRGMNLEQYLQYTGMDMPLFREQNKEQANQQVKVRLLLEKISSTEKVEVTDEDVEKHINEMAESYKMEVDKLKEMLSTEQLDSLKEELVVQKTIDMLVENAKFI